MQIATVFTDRPGYFVRQPQRCGGSDGVSGSATAGTLSMLTWLTIAASLSTRQSYRAAGLTCSFLRLGFREEAIAFSRFMQDRMAERKPGEGLQIMCASSAWRSC